jgi:hypothetical protein
MNKYGFIKSRLRAIFWGFDAGFWLCLAAIVLVVVGFLIYYPDW